MQRSSSIGDELPPGEKLCGGQYTIERYLNSGGFGVTYLARDSLGRSVVIKECFPSAMCHREGRTVRLRSGTSDDEFGSILELFEKEARALAALQHPYIVGVHQYFRDNSTAYMAMDFVDGRTLLDIIENDPHRLTPADVSELLTKILQALSYVHGHDILHRDISPDNILIDADNLPVLIDFGAARESATRVSRVLSKVLTVKDGYSPQEFYLAGSDHAQSSDLYALAATFYHVLNRKAPPSSNSRLAATARNNPDPLEPLGEVEGFEPYFIDAINRNLSVFPKDRLQTAAAWREAIDQDIRQRAMMRAAEQDQELEQRVADLVADFDREMQERERKAREALEAQKALTEEDYARIEAEERAREEEEERRRIKAAEDAQREADEIQALVAAERAARAAARAVQEAEEARQFHQALKKKPVLADFETEEEFMEAMAVYETERAERLAASKPAEEPEDAPQETPEEALERALSQLADRTNGTANEQTNDPSNEHVTQELPDDAPDGASDSPDEMAKASASIVLPRRVRLSESGAESETLPDRIRPARNAANGDETPAQDAPPRRALFGGRLALSVGGKGNKS